MASTLSYRSQFAARQPDFHGFGDPSRRGVAEKAALRAGIVRAQLFSRVVPRHTIGAMLTEGRFWSRALSVLLAGCLACSGSQKSPASALRDPEVVRYRLLLRDNPVDKDGAFRCYGRCQSEPTPDGYLQCLQGCPGFEITSGVKCASYEVPPVAACFTARKVPLKDEMDPSLVVLAVVANVAIVVALASVCASTSTNQCGYVPVTPQ